ncbi:MAG: glycoside hydrolase [Nitrosopumilus sp.]|uniref:sialidase family protein n=1 Tax=Nitrosopumilus sp. TaxID=2024843 RepID=UPI002430D3D2|nr:sialidase family protein [Nitrosopumilus sp.]MCV0367576.1 glycoside hydrolase [Nitrosopumilus sp.]
MGTGKLFLGLFVLANLFFATSPAFADESIKTVSDSPINSVSPSITADGNNVFLVWVEHSSYSGSPHLFFSKSNDGGNTFSKPKEIIDLPGSSIVPKIVSDGTNLFLTWTYRFQGDQHSEIYFSKSTDGGKTFSKPFSISDERLFSTGSRIAIDGKNIFIVWNSIISEKNYHTNRDIFLTKSTDGGETFSKPKNLTNNEGSSSGPNIETDGKSIFVAWSDDYEDGDAVFISKSIDGGDTFSEPTILSKSWRYSNNPSIAIDDSNVFVTWRSNGDGDVPEVYFSKSIDGGETYSTPKILSTQSGYTSNQSVKTDGTNIFVIWALSDPKSRYVVLSTSIDGGDTFSKPKPTGNNIGFSDSQEMVINDTNLLLIWRWAEKLEQDSSDLKFVKLGIGNSSAENYLEETYESITSKSSNEDTHQVNKTMNQDLTDKPSIKQIKWLGENGADYTVGGRGVIRLDNSDLNLNKTLIDIPIVHVWSDTDSKGILVDIIETGANTGIFYADIEFSGIESSHLQLHVSNGDSITVSFNDSITQPLIDTMDIISFYASPHKQLKSGILPSNIVCDETLEKIYRPSGHTAVCVTPETREKLIERGWGH